MNLIICRPHVYEIVLRPSLIYFVMGGGLIYIEKVSPICFPNYLKIVNFGRILVTYGGFL